jgi:circadian clock protein KaiB
MHSVSSSPHVNSPTFKGIALFTPGGDLVYCIDPDKLDRWHIQLCVALQNSLGLSELPHFLVPCYSATIDRWLDPATQQLKTSAEASPRVLKYQPLLNIVFGLGDVVWRSTERMQDLCDPMAMVGYRHQFPQLWQEHDLIVKLDKARTYGRLPAPSSKVLSASAAMPTQGYVLRLYISGHTAATTNILKKLHELLEDSLKQPYTLKVIDIYKHPDQAEVDQIAATPTLVRIWPQPIKRMVGNLDDVNRILQILSVSPSHVL